MVPRQRFRTVASAFLVLGLTISSVCLTAAEEIKIGTLFPYTGGLAAYGPAIRNGAVLAVDLINQSGGVLGKQVKLAENRDTQTEATIAIDAAQKAVNIDKLPVIIGALSSGVTVPVATSVTIPKKVVLISPASTSPEITNIKDDGFLFRTVPSDALQCQVLAKVAKEQHFSTISIIYVNNTYGEGLSQAMQSSFEALGGKVLKTVAFSPGGASYRSEIQKAVKGDPDALLLIAYPENGVKILRQAIEFGLASKFLLTDGMKAPEVIKNVGAKYLNGTYGTAPAPLDSAIVKNFREAYQQKFGEMPPKPYIDTCFDATILAALAIQKAGAANGTAIKDHIRDIANAPGEKVDFTQLTKAISLLKEGKEIDYEGASGSLTLDQHGDISSGSYGIWKIDNGKIVDVRVEVIE